MPYEQCTLKSRNITLAETLDRALNKGVVLCGDLAISVADVDLIFVGIRLLLASVETARRMEGGHREYGSNKGYVRMVDDDEPVIGSGCCSPSARSRIADDREHAEVSLPRLDAHPERVEKGLGRLVLTLIELIRELLGKQALRRVEAGSLSDEEVERLGETLMKLEHKMEELKKVFGLDDDDLALDLGPLGDLM